MTIERDYIHSVDPTDCIETVKDEGGLLLRGFTPPDEQNEIENEVLAQDLPRVDRSLHAIPEEFSGANWEFSQSPPSVLILGKRVCAFVRLGGVAEWEPTRVQVRLSQPDEIGVEWHRDYKRDLRIIAVASFINPARFGIRLKRGEVFWEVKPGDIVLLRAPLLVGKKDNRPQHKALAPTDGRRLALVYRQEFDETPDLEPSDE